MKILYPKHIPIPITIKRKLPFTSPPAHELKKKTCYSKLFFCYIPKFDMQKIYHLLNETVPKNTYQQA